MAPVYFGNPELTELKPGSEANEHIVCYSVRLLDGAVFANKEQCFSWYQEPELKFFGIYRPPSSEIVPVAIRGQYKPLKRTSLCNGQPVISYTGFKFFVIIKLLAQSSYTVHISLNLPTLAGVSCEHVFEWTRAASALPRCKLVAVVRHDQQLEVG